MMGDKTSSMYKIGGDIEVNRVGYGAMQLTGKGVFGDVDDRESAKAVLQAAVKAGVNFIDTADSYGPHTCERLIAEALYPYADGLVIATKGGFDRPGPANGSRNGPEHIRETINGSLQRLGVDRIDLWQLHRFDPKVPVEETLGVVAEAVKAGKIRYVGLSEVGIEQIEQAEKITPIVSVQNKYNLADRQWEDVIDYTAKRNMAFIPWFPLASGPATLEDKVAKIAANHNATTAQIALAWLLKRSPNILLIPGTKSIEHLKENLLASTFELTDDEFSEL